MIGALGTKRPASPEPCNIEAAHLEGVLHAAQPAVAVVSVVVVVGAVVVRVLDLQR